MKNYKLIYISDLNMGGADSAEDSVPRSGYANIAMELCRRLTEMGHEIKVLGLGYTGQEHREKFSIIPCNSLQDVVGYANNLKVQWGAEAVICALDIHQFQESIFPVIRQIGLKYICITPLESDPLCITWANLLKDMDKVFFISQFGADEAQKAGVKAEHIEIGIDTKSWRLRTEQEYTAIRKNLGYDEDDFVVLTVADNQERKNLGRGIQVCAELKRRGVKVKHIIVTREHSNVGWKLYDVAFDVIIPPANFAKDKDEYRVNLSSDLRVFQNGIPFADLFALYCASDAYLCASRGEGLGIPLMEAMSAGVPVVANRTGAIPELLAEGRGWIVDWYSWYIDPFGNQRRYEMSIWSAVDELLKVKEGGIPAVLAKDAARKYMESKDWNKSANQIVDALNEIFKSI